MVGAWTGSVTRPSQRAFAPTLTAVAMIWRPDVRGHWNQSSRQSGCGRHDGSRARRRQGEPKRGDRTNAADGPSHRGGSGTIRGSRKSLRQVGSRSRHHSHDRRGRECNRPDRAAEHSPPFRVATRSPAYSLRRRIFRDASSVAMAEHRAGRRSLLLAANGDSVRESDGSEGARGEGCFCGLGDCSQHHRKH